LTAAVTRGRADPYGLATAIPLCVIWLLFATSGYVKVEPAPFDLLFMALFPIFVLFGMRIPYALGPALFLIFVFLVGNFIGTFRGPRFDDSLRHVMITGLLCAVSIFVACIVYRYGERGLRALMNGWVFAAALTSLLGILGYFGALGGLSDFFLLYGRAKGGFKDPNVFAPFLVIPAIYCIYEVLTRSHARALLNLAILGVIMLGLFLSFSRGGWANFVISALCAGALWLAASRDKRFRARLLVCAVFGAFAVTFAISWLVSLESIGELFAVRAQLTQDYDSAATGRFAGQLVTMQKILVNPLGLGARGFLPDWFEQPHNVYLFLFMSGGWAGGFAYVGLLLLTLAQGFRTLRRRAPHNVLMVVLLACFIGLVLEGFIVDTDHWRHFFIVMGAIWGLHAYDMRTHGTAVTPSSDPAPAALRGTITT